MKNSTQLERFNQLRALFSQSPLPASELDELIELAKTYDKSMHEYLVAHKSEL